MPQMVTDQGDFKGKLHQFIVVETPKCVCGNGSETVQYVLYRCPRTHENTPDRAAMESENEPWSPREGTYIKSKRAYKALKSSPNECSVCKRIDNVFRIISCPVDMWRLKFLSRIAGWRRFKTSPAVAKGHRGSRGSLLPQGANSVSFLSFGDRELRGHYALLDRKR